MAEFLNEAELATFVVRWLQDLRWEVYQEVQVERGGHIADIVAVQNRRVWVIETKMTLGLAVLEQGLEWGYYSNYVSVAVPKIRRANQAGRRAAHMFCSDHGIGVLRVSRSFGYSGREVSEDIAPRLNRTGHHKDLLESLHEGHQTGVKAGSNTGGHWTPFKHTCREVRDYVAGHQGCTMKELIDNIETHYSSTATARSSLSQWIQQDVVKGVRGEIKKGKLRLYAKEIDE